MSLCSVEGCGGKRHGHGFCRKHYHVKFAERGAAWRAANQDKVKAHKRAEYVRHADTYKARAAKWVRNNSEKRKSIVKQWDGRNRGALCAKDAKRKASYLNATPAWANTFFIKEAYGVAVLRTKVTGIKWHVDHLVPLQSKKVCGLHVENNLRVIPAIDNRRKSNIIWPDMPN